MSYFVHPSAVIEEGVQIGDGTSVWDNVHIRRNAKLGEQCIIGDKTHIAYDVVIGNRVKTGAFVNICPGVTIEDGVMVAIGAIFTNDMFPRATTPDLKTLRPSDPDEKTLRTRVCHGATVGANATIRGGVVIGRWAMVGMGALVTRSVPDFHLVVGSPARSVACLCRCGEPVARFVQGEPPETDDTACPACGLRYAIHGGKVTELTPPA
ncbi:MAG: acyltransferase [Planctomycetota bacterium]